ncbi:hypothetical protein KFL_001880230 [Klebsormidium nitens]|uniref:PARP catalytic domain-containing protein n=1 Tax=Klebsormidium nitens TaxID=105231 RepID=A0A1Y1I0H0_KLENI|nr:hypothetical protein KFL_001880230 [Klebsormidium nitens]|eukprot:GAQ84430.1 hypothetical protein KFL_001880230 [Klebsormidium nitens]
MGLVPAGKKRYVWPWWSKKADPELEELRKKLADILSEENVREQLSGWSKSIQLSSFVPNPHALSGRLHERFLARLYQHRKREKGSSASCFSGSSSNEDSFSLLRFVFHGTHKRNLDSILRNGMIRWYQTKGCDWFGLNPETSKPYCRNRFEGTLLVFLVLPVKRAVKRDDTDVLTMRYASYQLPIGTVKWVLDAKRQNILKIVPFF